MPQNELVILGAFMSQRGAKQYLQHKSFQEGKVIWFSQQSKIRHRHASSRPVMIIGYGCMSALLFRIPGHQTSHYVAKAQRRHVFHYPRQKSYQHKTSETTSCGWADAKEFMSTQKHFNKFPWIYDTTQVPLPGNHVQAHTRWLMSTQKRVNESPWHRYTMKCKVLTSYEPNRLA